MHTVWFTSDTHFFHTNIIKYCNRPFANAHEMNKVLIKNWNELVKPNDTIYHLGDVAMGTQSLLEIVKELNGHKILIKGNHDRSIRIMLNYFDEVYLDRILVIDGLTTLLQHHPKPGSRQLCGHVHNKWKHQGNIINVGVDVWDYKPISLDKIVEEFRNGKS